MVLIIHVGKGGSGPGSSSVTRVLEGLGGGPAGGLGSEACRRAVGGPEWRWGPGATLRQVGAPGPGHPAQSSTCWRPWRLDLMRSLCLPSCSCPLAPRPPPQVPSPPRLTVRSFCALSAPLPPSPSIPLPIQGSLPVDISGLILKRPAAGAPRSPAEATSLEPGQPGGRSGPWDGQLLWAVPGGRRGGAQLALLQPSSTAGPAPALEGLPIYYVPPMLGLLGGFRELP